MNAAQFKLTLVFLVFAVIGFGPVSPGCLIGLTVLALRPEWFYRLIQDLYRGKTIRGSFEPGKHIRLQAIAVLLVLLGIDILPFPVTPSIVLPLIFIRPTWLYRSVMAIYAGAPR